jgi:glycosyltransferase involved in cell wall biosynthesis
MKVLACSNLFPLEPQRSREGVTQAVRQLLEGAMAHGVESVQVVRFRPAVIGWKPQWPRRVRSGPFDVLDVPKIGMRHVFSATLTRAALRTAGTLARPDVIACHMVDSFIPAARVFGRSLAPLVFVVHSSDVDQPRLAWCLDRADAVLCRSEAVRRQLAARSGIEPLGVVPSGVDEADFGTPQRDLASGPLRIVMASMFIACKHLPETLRALALLGPGSFRLDLFGDGPLRPTVERLVDDLGIRAHVALHGFRPRTEVLAAMRDAHLFCQPSAPETFGLAYLEAMANGCVVVGHAGWGIDGIVQDGVNGFLVEQATPECIAGRIRAYLASNREVLHARALATAREHTADAAAANYARLLGRSIGLAQ